jgi:hypothetical protein
MGGHRGKEGTSNFEFMASQGPTFISMTKLRVETDLTQSTPRGFISGASENAWAEGMPVTQED